ncbi:WhiB family transcriptional regulator [Buchananella felis]|uniref:WhiB family transcriptional regulator n=1 Tax=Buchananella felis TaxID=3231492 RepID=UPI003527D882
MSTQADQSWTVAAACSGLEPDALFVAGREQRRMRDVCADCPVRVQCLADALQSGSMFGVWGGLTERERRALMRARPDVTDWETWILEADDFVAEQLRARHRPRVLSFKQTA